LDPRIGGGIVSEPLISPRAPQGSGTSGGPWFEFVPSSWSWDFGTFVPAEWTRESVQGVANSDELVAVINPVSVGARTVIFNATARIVNPGVGGALEFGGNTAGYSWQQTATPPSAIGDTFHVTITYQFNVVAAQDPPVNGGASPAASLRVTIPTPGGFVYATNGSVVTPGEIRELGPVTVGLNPTSEFAPIFEGFETIVSGDSTARIVIVASQPNEIVPVGAGRPLADVGVMQLSVENNDIRSWNHLATWGGLHGEFTILVFQATLNDASLISHGVALRVIVDNVVSFATSGELFVSELPGATIGSATVGEIELLYGASTANLFGLVGRQNTPAASMGDRNLDWSLSPTGVVNLSVFGAPQTVRTPLATVANDDNTWRTQAVTVVPATVGTTTLTVETGNGASRQVTIRVLPPPVVTPPTATLAWLSPQHQSLQVGQQIALVATGGQAPYSFEISDQSTAGNLATIAAATTAVPLATLTAGPGLGWVDVIVRDGSGDTAGNVRLNIIPADLEIEPIHFNQVNTTALADVKGGEAPFSFVIDNPAIATITTNADGTIATVTALAHGDTIITVTDVNNATASAVITVPGEFVFVPGDREVRVGETIRLHATGGIAPYTAEFTEAEAASLASISVPVSTVPEVVVEGLAEGIVAVRFRDGNNHLAGVIQIRILPENVIVVPTPTQLAVAPVTAPIAVGGTVQLNVTGGTAPYTFVASPDGIVTVGANGLVTGVAAGTAAVIVTDDAGASVEVTVTVTAQQVIPNAFTRVTITTPRTVRLRPNDRIGISVAPLDVVAAEEPLFSIQPGGTASAEIGLRNGQITNVTAPGTIIIRVTSANDPSVFHEVQFTLLAN
jgi:hypothetical protein